MADGRQDKPARPGGEGMHPEAEEGGDGAVDEMGSAADSGSAAGEEEDLDFGPELPQDDGEEAEARLVPPPSPQDDGEEAGKDQGPGEGEEGEHAGGGEVDGGAADIGAADGQLDGKEGDDGPRPSMSCVRLETLDQLKDVIAEQGHDFWVTCLADGAHVSMQKSLEKMKCDGVPAAEAFTHCYITKSPDIKAESNALIDQFGLGLRRKRVHSNTGPGYLLALVNLETFSSLCRKNMQLAATDRRLSTEERLRRSRMKFEVVSEKRLFEVAMQYQLSFWLTTYSNIDVKECKKRIVAARMDNQYATERFFMCYIHQARNLLKSAKKLVGECGMGLRKNKIHSGSKPGCLALLISDKEHNQNTRKKDVSSITPGGAPGAPKKPKKPKQARTDEGKAKIADILDPNLEQLVAAYGPFGEEPEQDQNHEVGEQVPEVSVQTLIQEEDQRRRKQIEFLERKIAVLLPTLGKVQLSTPLVQSKLEEMMQKPAGRLDRFRDEIERLWMACVEADLHRRQMRVLERKLEVLLPTLPRNQLTTAFVQAKLEEAMQRPAGRFDKFRSDIDVFWRAFLRCEDGLSREPLKDKLLNGGASTVQAKPEADDDVEFMGMCWRPPRLAVPHRREADYEATGVDLISDSEDDDGQQGEDGDDDSDLEILDVKPPAPAAPGVPVVWNSLGGIGTTAHQASLTRLAQQAAALASTAFAARGPSMHPPSVRRSRHPVPSPDKALPKVPASEEIAGGCADVGVEGGCGDMECDEQGEAAHWVQLEARYSGSGSMEGGQYQEEGADEGSDLEVDEFGFQMAVEELTASAYEGDEAESALQLLLRSRPAPELLADGDAWREPLEDAAAKAVEGSRVGALARRVIDRWRHLSGDGDDTGRVASSAAPPAMVPAGTAAAAEQLAAAPTLFDAAFAALAHMQAYAAMVSSASASVGMQGGSVLPRAPATAGAPGGTLPVKIVIDD